MRNKIKNVVLASALSMLVSSCSFLNLEPNVIEASTFYNSEQEVLYGLAGIYGALSTEAVYGNYYSLMLSNVDDLSYFNRSTTNNFSQMYAHDASSSEIYEAWTKLYAGIGNANSFMEAVENSEYDPEHKLWNEARFLRAYYHFLLTQAWGDVPKKEHSTKTPDDVMCEATPQYELLQWVVSEMEACLPLAETVLTNAPSRVVKVTMQGILARVYLFMAGESVEGNEAHRAEFYGKARDYAWDVIQSARGLGENPLNISLNPSYSQVFINMISNEYDKKYNESLWEVEFFGDRSSASSWSNGRIGDLIGLQSSGSEKFETFKCNYSYAQYNGSIKLWDMYWKTDRTQSDIDLMATVPAGTDLTSEANAEKYGWDKRHVWNMCPYNYNGHEKYPPYPTKGASGSGSCAKSIDKTPYVGKSETLGTSVSTSEDPTVARGIRNCGKWRREIQYEGQMTAKDLYTKINYPILRYSDVLLMYAEAANEANNGPTTEAMECVLEVRERAGIDTDRSAYGDYQSFQTLVRNERARELCFESLRKYDLIRWGIFVESMKDYLNALDQVDNWGNQDRAVDAYNIGVAVQDKHVLLPIPSIELGVNTELTQNKLW